LIAKESSSASDFIGGAMRVWVCRALAQGEAYVSAEPERERGHGVDDSVPDAAHTLIAPTGLLAVRKPKVQNRRYLYRYRG